MYTYLVVDDESIIRKGVIAKLEPLSDKLTCAGEAENGAQALELMSLAPPDILITDMNMPQMDGSEFLDEVMKSWEDIQIIVISGYKDFEYAKQAVMAKAVDYLLKPFSRQDIQKAVLRAIEILEQKAETRHFSEEHAEQLERARFETDLHQLKTILLHEGSALGPLMSERLRQISGSHKHIVLTVATPRQIDEELMLRFRQECGFGNLGLYLYHPVNPSIALFVLFLPQNAVLSTIDLSGQVAHSLHGTLTDSGYNEVLMGVSGMSGELSSLRESFREGVAAINTHIPGSPDWLYYDTGLNSLLQPFNWADEDKLLFRVEAGEAGEAAALIRALFAGFKRLSGFRIMDIKDYCLNLVQQIRNLVTSYFGKQQRETKVPSSITQIVWDTIFNLGDLEEYFVRLFFNISNTLKHESVYTGNDIAEKIKLYIQRNYNKYLSLELVADLFYLNPSYCSHLFHNQTGWKFVDYVNYVRLEEAKNMLLNTNGKMSQIAKAAGYSNDKYFFRVFKKTVGCTPEQYRTRRNNISD